MKLSIKGKLLSIEAETITESKKLYDLFTEVKVASVKKVYKKRKGSRQSAPTSNERKVAFEYGLRTGCSANELSRKFGLSEAHSNKIRTSVKKEEASLAAASSPFTTDFLTKA